MNTAMQLCLKFEQKLEKKYNFEKLVSCGSKACLEELLNRFANKVPKHEVQCYCSSSNTRFHNLLRV